MQRDYAYHSARRRRHLDAPEDVGRRAGERAVARLNPGRPENGMIPVVFDPRIGSSLIGHLISAIGGGAITRKTSFLLEALGTRVFGEGVNVRDDPHRPHGLRSRPFDGEGLPVSPTLIVEDGMLETWLLDSASARQLGLEPTGHAARGVGGNPGVSTSNLFMEAGAVPVETLIGDIASGIYLTELFGQGVNLVTGDYSRGGGGVPDREWRTDDAGGRIYGCGKLEGHVPEPDAGKRPGVPARRERPDAKGRWNDGGEWMT